MIRMTKKIIYYLTIALFLGASVYFMWDAYRLYTITGSIKGQQINTFIFPLFMGLSLALALNRKNNETVTEFPEDQTIEIESGGNPYASGHAVAPDLKAKKGGVLYIALAAGAMIAAIVVDWAAISIQPRTTINPSVDPMHLSIFSLLVTPMLGILFSLLDRQNRNFRTLAQILFGVYAFLFIARTSGLVAALLSR